MYVLSVHQNGARCRSRIGTSTLPAPVTHRHSLGTSSEVKRIRGVPPSEATGAVASLNRGNTRRTL